MAFRRLSREDGVSRSGASSKNIKQASTFIILYPTETQYVLHFHLYAAELWFWPHGVLPVE